MCFQRCCDSFPRALRCYENMTHHESSCFTCCQLHANSARIFQAAFCLLSGKGRALVFNNTSYQMSGTTQWNKITKKIFFITFLHRRYCILMNSLLTRKNWFTALWNELIGYLKVLKKIYGFACKSMTLSVVVFKSLCCITLKIKHDFKHSPEISWCQFPPISPEVALTRPLVLLLLLLMMCLTYLKTCLVALMPLFLFILLSSLPWPFNGGTQVRKIWSNIN